MAKVEVVRKTSRGKGSSDTATLNAMFPGSPSLPTANQGQYTNAKVAELVKSVVDDIQSGNPDFPNFDPNFGAAPDLTTVEKAADGTLVWNHYSPPPASPGTPYAHGEAAARQVTSVPDTNPVSSGVGSTKSPNDSSRQISTQFPGDGEAVVGNLEFGKSGATR
jgi:hypothetical protein